MRKVSGVGIAAIALLLLGGCGPYEQESGQAVMLMAPLITVLGYGLAFVLKTLWKPLAPELELRFRPALRTALVLCALLIPVFFALDTDDDLILIALWAVGTSYASFLLVFLRVCICKSFRRWYGVQLITPWLILYPPALFLGYLGSETVELQAFPGLLWTIPGYLGLVTGPLLLLLIVEVVIRRVLHARRLAAQALPRPLPTATATIRKD